MFKTPHTNARRAFTLVELVITMALVAIIAAVAIGIVVITSKTAGSSENSLVRITELRQAKESIMLWASSHDDGKYTLSVYRDRLEITDNGGEVVAQCAISGREMNLIPNPSGGESSRRFAVVKEAAFFLMENSSVPSEENSENSENNEIPNPSFLVRCTLTYTHENGEDDFDFVFAVRAADCVYVEDIPSGS
ncbi:MAG: prepilin-type N-terminal cleavage/methylation domain-containing protein [Clostridiales bacterium]|jgi:prepilin-type N-terminal cleavage/methylation domain-containing protein|nr:prepilin-type N-terminal cleavage/methylation domain-containing protein [Clostridiales bacterium]